jgi:hypothetical protein
MCRDRERRVLVWFLLLLCGETTTCVHAGIYVNALFENYEFSSVNYFDVGETRWPYFDVIILGRVAVLPSLNLDSLNLDQVFVDKNETDENATRPFDHFDILEFDAELDRWKDSPKFLVVDFGSASFEAAMHNTSLAAEKMGVDFVVLVVGSNVTWQEKLSFWWSHRFPGSPTKELLPGGNTTHPHFFLAVGGGEGTGIRALIERENRLLENYSQYELYFGIDNIDAIEGRDFVAQLIIYVIMILSVLKCIGNETGRNSNSPPGDGNRASYTQFTGDDLGMGEIQSASAVQDCPVCLETMQPGDTVRILPCRHALHHDCINGWFEHGKYSCPLCKMDLQSHLEEHRSASLSIIAPGSTVRRGWRILWPFGRRIDNSGAGDQLIVSFSHATSLATDDENVGDLELTEEPRTIT